jgi:hypothetical protein
MFCVNFMELCHFANDWCLLFKSVHMSQEYGAVRYLSFLSCEVCIAAIFLVFHSRKCDVVRHMQPTLSA